MIEDKYINPDDPLAYVRADLERKRDDWEPTVIAVPSDPLRQIPVPISLLRKKNTWNNSSMNNPARGR
mgnify:CR=1 FL=1